MASVEPRSNPPFVALYKFRSSWTNSLSRTAKCSISLPMHPSAFFNPISLWTPLKLLWQVPFGKGEIDFHIRFTHHFANVSDRFGLWRVHQLSQQGHRIAGIAWYKLLRKRRRQTNPVPLIGGLICSLVTSWGESFKMLTCPQIVCFLRNYVLVLSVVVMSLSRVQARNRPIKTADSGYLRHHLAVFVRR